MDPKNKANQILQTSHRNKKQWRVPTLRKLPIAATRGLSDMNEGQGKGKGQAGLEPVS
jgi:hypothetical protein